MRLLLLLVALASLLTAGCAQLTAGRSYVLAKQDRDGYLRDVHEKLNPPTSLREANHPANIDSWDELVINNLEIRLSDFFIKYLQALDRPEVVIYSKVTIRDRASTDEPVVINQVVLDSEDPSAHTAANQGAGGSLKNVPAILPSLRYEGQDITISLRIIEVDRDDNQRLSAILNTVGGVASSLDPSSAAAISAAQAVLSFIIANNPDDLEFAFDFGLSRNPASLSSSDLLPLPGGSDWNVERDLVIQPRIGRLVIIKSEHPNRAVYPTDQIALVTDSIRWVLMKATKLATLNLFNLYNEDKEYDRYARYFGYPLMVPLEGLEEPRLIAGYWHHVDFNPIRSLNPYYRGNELTKPLRFAGGTLGYTGSDEPDALTSYDDKSYFALAISSPEIGVTLKEAKSLSVSLDALKLNTSQLDPETFAKRLEDLKKEAESWIEARKGKASISKAVAQAPTVASAVETAGKKIDDQKDHNARRAMHAAAVQDLERAREQAATERCGLHVIPDVITAAPSFVELTARHPGGATYDGRSMKLTSQGGATADVGFSMLPGSRASTWILNNTQTLSGNYVLSINQSSTAPAKCAGQALPISLRFGSGLPSPVVCGSVLYAKVKSALRLRSEPNTSAKVLEKLGPGQTLCSLGKTTDDKQWIQVEAKGKTGWVSRALTSSTDPAGQ